MAATRVTRTPTSKAATIVRVSMAGEVVGISTPISFNRERIPAARPTPNNRPRPAENVPMSVASSRTPPSTCRRVAPTARSRATSRRRCATRTLKVFQMTKEPTSTEMPANTSSTVVKTPMASRTAAEPSAATWSPVSAWMSSGRIAAIRSRSSPALTPGSACTSTSSTRPTLSKTRCAVVRSKPAMVAPRRLSVSPKPMMPTRVNLCRPSWRTTSTLSPSWKPACSAVRASMATWSAPAGWRPCR